MLTREEFLQPVPRRYVDVPVSAGSLRLASWDGAARHRFEEAWEAWKKEHGYSLTHYHAFVLLFSAVDAAGQLLLTVADLAAVLAAVPSIDLERVSRVANRLNAVGEEEIEGLVKNSPGGPNCASG